MQTQIVKMINDFEHGRLSRRQLIAYFYWDVRRELGRDHRLRRSATRTRRTESGGLGSHLRCHRSQSHRAERDRCAAFAETGPETPRLETEGTRRLPYHRQRLAGAFPGRQARPKSLLLQHRELRSSRCGRETQGRLPHAQTRSRACVFCRSGRHRMSGRECVIR